MEKSVQQIMDETMCRPGYRWNDTLKRCLAAGASEPKADAEKPAAPAKPADSGRGDVRVNSAGIQQTGTKMGGKVSIK